MTREDIYDHLAQVYLGKRKEADHKKKKQLSAWLVINIVIMAIIFASAFYGLTAFLTQKRSNLKSNIVFALHNGPVRLEYDFKNSFAPVKSFALSISPVDATRYNKIQFSIRGKEEGTPGIVKVIFKNQRNESSSYYIQGVGLSWQDFSIPLSHFQEITDWANVTELSFVLESWNVNDKKGVVLIDDICFAGPGMNQTVKKN